MKAILRLLLALILLTAWGLPVSRPASASPAAVPLLSFLSPFSVAAGSPAFTLTVTGSGFSADSVVRWDGLERPTTFLSSTQLNAAIPAADVLSNAIVPVTVFTPGPTGGASERLNLSVYDRSGVDIIADGVLGQPNFSSSAANNLNLPGGANRLQSPRAAAIDPLSGRIFVSDGSNHRVLSWPSAPGFANSQAADLVLGQANFNDITPNTGGMSDATLSAPRGLALDGLGNLYVADSANHRVLVFSPPFSSGMSAALVIGTSGVSGADAQSFNSPSDVAVSSAGGLFVADYNNHRVLGFTAPLTTDLAADLVIGQPDFTSNAANQGALAPFAASLASPRGLALDGLGNLYVADNANHRVLLFQVPLANGMDASHVLGQPDFTSGAANQGVSTPSALSLSGPRGLAVDARGSLFVADYDNNRVLEYSAPLTGDAAADRVFGQADFDSGLPNAGGGSKPYTLKSPAGVAFDARGYLYVADQSNNRLLEYDLHRYFYWLPLIVNP